MRGYCSWWAIRVFRTITCLLAISSKMSQFPTMITELVILRLSSEGLEGILKVQSQFKHALQLIGWHPTNGCFSMRLFFFPLFLPSLRAAADAAHCLSCCSRIQARSYDSWQPFWFWWPKLPLPLHVSCLEKMTFQQLIKFLSCARRKCCCSSMPNCSIDSSLWDLWWNSRLQYYSISTGGNLLCRAWVACS